MMASPQHFATPPRTPLASRAHLWYRILRDLRGASARDALSLLFSAVADLVQFRSHCDAGEAPICRLGCAVYAPRLKARFLIRKRSDDIYSVMPRREADAHDAILDPLRPGDVFVDVGANVGYYTILASKRVGGQGHVLAIEAFQATAAQLRKNLAINGAGNVEVIEAAAWSEPGKAMPLRLKERVFGRVQAVTSPDHGGAEYAAGTVRIDDVCAAYPRIRMMKLDVEGAECEALKGARETLARTEAIVLECSAQEAETMQLLNEAGFAVKKLDFTTCYLAQRAISEQGALEGEKGTTPARSGAADGT